MMTSSQVLQFASAHLMQLSIAIVFAAIVIRLTSRRLPHLAFLICMLALAKCIVPPLITSPAGLFTLHSGLSFSPELDLFQGDDIVRLKQTLGGVPAAGDSGAWSSGLFGIPFWGVLTLGIWAIGSALLFVFSARKYRRVSNIISRCTPACRSFRMTTDALAAQLGLKRRVRIMISAENYGPACVGFFRPTLILPLALVSNWSDRLLKPVIAHELVHARRGDAAWGYVQYVAQIACWFHPLVWWLGRHAQLLCERCCDEEVLSNLKIAPADYGESLVRVLELRSVCKQLPVGSGMSPAQITRQRLHHLAAKAGTKRTRRCTWCVALLAAVIVLPGMRWVANPIYEARLNIEDKEYPHAINMAITSADWKRAIALLRPLVKKNPDNADALFFLGYSLHADGQIDEAIVFHRKATECEAMRPMATYNLACALALQGEEAAAIAALRSSIEYGFTPEINLTEDSDLACLYRLPEFAVLNASVILHRLTPELLGKLEGSAIQSLVKTPHYFKLPQAGETRLPASHGGNSAVATSRVRTMPNGPVTAKLASGFANHSSNRQVVDARKFANLPKGGTALFYYDGNARSSNVRIEARLRTPGGPQVQAELRMHSAQSGYIEQTIECSIETAGICFTRSVLITPQLLETNNQGKQVL